MALRVLVLPDPVPPEQAKDLAAPIAKLMPLTALVDP